MPVIDDKTIPLAEGEAATPAVGRNNNFDALRVLAAATVIYGHAHVLAAAPAVTVFGNAVESLAVKIFFVISGFLIAQSWVADANAFRYLAKRSLRIFPGLILLLVFTILVIGPAVTTLTVDQYFSQGAALWQYASYNLALFPAYSLPGVFSGNVTPAVNGSLWSLPVEFLMYLVFPLVYVISRAARTNGLLIGATVALCAASLYFLRAHPLTHPYAFYGTSLSGALDASPYFLIGCVFSATSLSRRLDATVALLLIGLVTFLQPSGAVASELALYIVLPYTVLSFATQATPFISKAGRFGDPSYGIYLYGFVIQQAVYHFAGRGMPPLHNAAVSIPLATVLAYLSWHLVEKHALRIRPRRGANSTVRQGLGFRGTSLGIGRRYDPAGPSAVPSSGDSV